MRNSTKVKQTYFRYCKVCEKKFKPNGRYTYYCDKCRPVAGRKPLSKGN